MSSNPDSLSTPCTRNCCLNDDDICLGCFRSVNEISLWTKVDEKTRHDFLINAESRKKVHNRTRSVILLKK
jgi:predicted Fe-S protein YdhL (DUF1289 family)